MIQTIFKSDSEKVKNSLEKFHLANSKKFFDTLAENDLLFIYKSDLHTITILSDEQKEILNRKDQFRALVDEYSECHYNNVTKKKEENKEVEEFSNGKIGFLSSR